MKVSVVCGPRRTGRSTVLKTLGCHEIDPILPEPIQYPIGIATFGVAPLYPVQLDAINQATEIDIFSTSLAFHPNHPLCGIQDLITQIGPENAKKIQSIQIVPPYRYTTETFPVTYTPLDPQFLAKVCNPSHL